MCRRVTYKEAIKGLEEQSWRIVKKSLWRKLLPPLSSPWHVSTHRCPPDEEGSLAARESEALMCDLWGPGGTRLEAHGQVSDTCLGRFGSPPAGKSCSCFGKWLHASGTEWSAVGESQKCVGVYVWVQDALHLVKEGYCSVGSAVLLELVRARNEWCQLR